MKILITLILAGFVIYLIAKICLYIYRPFFISKTLNKMHTQYSKLIAVANKEVERCSNDYEKWKSGDSVLVDMYSEGQCKNAIKGALEWKNHEQEVYEKFIRLRERSAGNYKKLGETISACMTYLNLREKVSQTRVTDMQAFSAGAITFAEFEASTNEGRIMIEEGERRLDVLLNGYLSRG